MGKVNRTFLALAVISVMIALASIPGTGQASAWMQTVPTAKPSNTQAPPPAPTNTRAPVLATQVQGVATATAQPENTRSLEQPASTNTPIAATETVEATEQILDTAVPTTQPTDNGTNPATQSYIKMLYFLVCGLGGLAGIVAIVIFAIRKAGEPPTPPSVGSSGT